ncbi:MAG: nitroreductase family deazaflavin-dependent oxidoreductase [Actinomycetota bacterium]
MTRAVQRVGKPTANRAVIALLRRGVPFPGINRKSMVVLTHTGRKSGIERHTPTGYIPVDETTIWVVSEHGRRSDWYRNARAAGSLGVLLDGRQRRASVRLLAGEDPAAALRRIPSGLVAFSNRALWSEPAVVEIRLQV